MGREGRHNLPAPPQHSAGERLDSWKEIASYLKRHVRTVRRWEGTQGLPVHRHPYLKRGLVYAYRDELDTWWHSGLGPPEGASAAHARGRPVSGASTERVMLAVLPFENLTGDSGQEYFSDGLTVEVITHLGRLHAAGLGVIARASVMQYKGARKAVHQIGRELGVDYVLEGSVRRAAERVRISVQLVEARGQAHLWAESYDRDLSDILVLQEELAQAVAEKIGLKLAPRGQTRLARPPAVHPVAFEAYLKGRFHWYRLSPTHLDTALEYFQLALQQDPSCALAHAGIADVWLVRADSGLMPPSLAFPQVRSTILKAIELDDSLAESHVIMANCRFLNEWDWAGAEAEFQEAIQISPNCADAHFMYSDFLSATRRFRESLAERERTQRLDPLNFFFQCFFGWHLVYMGRYDEAIGELLGSLATEPDFPAAHLGLWGAFYKKGMQVEALAEARKFFGSLSDAEVVEALDGSHEQSGYRRAMRRAAEALAARSKRVFIPAVRIARLYAHAGEEGRAVDWLERAYEERDPPLVHLGVGWDWDSLRENRRFEDLLRRMSLPG